MTQRPLRISSHDIDLPSSVRSLISERADNLEHFYPQLVGCAILVQGPGRHHRRGGPYSVRLDLRVPDAEPIIVARQRAEDLQVAIRESFDAAQRRLEDLARVQRRKVKRHLGQPTGHVVRVFPAEGYGFIQTDDAPTREVYFHRNSLLDVDLDDLTVGTAVRFHEEAGLEGPQASSVTVIGHSPTEATAEAGAQLARVTR